MILIILTKDHFAMLFTSSEKMHKAVSKLAYLLAVTMLLNSVQPVISGTKIYCFLLEQSQNKGKG